MSSLSKLIIATGCSSGLGFEAIKKLLLQSSQPYTFLLGVRDTHRSKEAYDAVPYDAKAHSLKLLPLELADLKSVKSFAERVGDEVKDQKVDYLFLNAALSKDAKGDSPYGSKWSEAYVVNHLSQHYLLHLLHPHILRSQSRIIFTSSGAIRNATIDTLSTDVLAKSGTGVFPLYSSTKFIQLLGAEWWRRQLPKENVIVAVSPGLIPATGLGRHWEDNAEWSADKMKLHPDAKGVDVGADSLLAAFTRTDLPDDPERLFLTSWGEWWEKDVYKAALDRELQDRWCLSKGDIEREEGL